MTKGVIQGIFLVLLLFGLGVIWYRVPLPCQGPLEYSIGSFDARFGMSEAQFLANVAAAEKPWEAALGKDLFKYNPEATFTLNLIYDERQQRTQEEQTLEASRKALEEKQESLQMNQTKLLATFTAKKGEYEEDLQQFQNELSSYNAQVEYWNRQGGAPAEEFAKLEKRKKKLRQEQRDLESRRLEVNKIANQINATSHQTVATVNAYNSQVNDFNERHGNQTEDFEEGIYDGKQINIYQFENEASLRGVLAHELGHWIGLDHVENPSSILYHLMGKQDFEHLTLSPEDQRALSAVCSKSRWDIFLEKISLVKSLLQTVFGSSQKLSN